MENATNYVGIQIGDYHTWGDFQLYLNSVYIGEAIQERNTVDIPGKGTVVLSDFLDYPVYKDRTLWFEFDVEDGGFPGYYKDGSELKNALHGENKKIILDEDSDFYWFGHVSVDVQKRNSVISAVTIACTVQPYKLKKEKTSVTLSVAGETTAVCNNLKKHVVPTILTDAEFRIEFEGISYAVPAGESIVPDILFKSGDNILRCYGTGNITFLYQEGSL